MKTSNRVLVGVGAGLVIFIVISCCLAFTMLLANGISELRRYDAGDWPDEWPEEDFQGEEPSEGKGPYPPSTLHPDNAVGLTAPDFKLESIGGDNVYLSDYRGQPVLLNFWATWCGPCLDEMPHLQEAYRTHSPDLMILAVEGRDPLDEVLSVVEAEGLTFPVLLGTETVERQYGIYAYPTSFFIDENGVIQAVAVGSMSADYLEAELAKIGILP